jgi:hypothetical protein
MDRAEFEAYRRHHVRVRRLSWATVMGVSVAWGFALGVIWSFAIGIPVATVLVLAGLEAHLRWDRARWIKRFPELAQPHVKWRRTYGA